MKKEGPAEQAVKSTQTIHPATSKAEGRKFVDSSHHLARRVLGIVELLDLHILLLLASLHLFCCT